MLGSMATRDPVLVCQGGALTYAAGVGGDIPNSRSQDELYDYQALSRKDTGLRMLPGFSTTWCGRGASSLGVTMRAFRGHRRTAWERMPHTDLRL